MSLLKSLAAVWVNINYDANVHQYFSEYPAGLTQQGVPHSRPTAENDEWLDAWKSIYILATI